MNIIPDNEDYDKHDMLQYFLIALLSLATLSQSFYIAQNTKQIGTNTDSINNIVEYISDKTSKKSTANTHSINKHRPEYIGEKNLVRGENYSMPLLTVNHN